MPQNTSLTYGQLHKKLQELGFQERKVEVDGKRGRMFEHPRVAASMIVLPERNPDDLVEPFYMNRVLALLKSRGFLPETNPLLT